VLYAAAAIQVSSNAAPVPSYSEIIAQFPLPRVPQIFELQKVAMLQSATPPATTIQMMASSQEQAQRVLLQSRIVELQSPVEALQSEYRLESASAHSLGASPLTVSTQESARAFQQASSSEERAKGLQDLFVAEAQSRLPAVQSTVPIPKIMTRVEPVYPAAMQSTGVEGSVLLSVNIGTDGHVVDIKSINSTNFLFTEPAVEAVKQWVFEPTLVGGKASTITVQLPVDFKLVTQGMLGTLNVLQNLPDNRDDLRAYLSELALLRNRTVGVADNPTGVGSLVIARSTVPFSFKLATDQKGKYSIETGGASYTY